LRGNKVVEVVGFLIERTEKTIKALNIRKQIISNKYENYSEEII